MAMQCSEIVSMSGRKRARDYFQITVGIRIPSEELLKCYKPCQLLRTPIYFLVFTIITIPLLSFKDPRSAEQIQHFRLYF